MPAIILNIYQFINVFYFSGLVTLGELREREAQQKLEQEKAELEKGVKKKKKRKEISTLSFNVGDEGLILF